MILYFLKWEKFSTQQHNFWSKRGFVDKQQTTSCTQVFIIALIKITHLKFVKYFKLYLFQSRLDHDSQNVNNVINQSANDAVLSDKFQNIGNRKRYQFNNL